MNAASKSRPLGRPARPGADAVETNDKQTPYTDMQGEDAGTAASGNDGRGTAVQGAMKQTSKTANERGSEH